MSGPDLGRVALTISAYRSDDSVIGLLRKAFGDGVSPFGVVIVIDSFGSGSIAERAKAEGWSIVYENSAVNLGSAGNLARRLRRAAQFDCDWCLTLNHDASLDLGKVKSLLDCAIRHSNVGAVYPRLRLTSADNVLDRPRRTFAAASAMTDTDSTDSGDFRVKWSSSNGALYALSPVRAGLRLWPELWMGYEDLAIGWELEHRRLSQWLCADVVVDDNYEFRFVSILGRKVQLADKAPWYEYYGTRNILLIARGTRFSGLGIGNVARRWLTDLGLILLVRDQKLRRLDLWIRGLWAGLTNRTGKGPVP